MLPSTIVKIIDLIGHNAAMSIVDEMGGQRIRFPATKSGPLWDELAEIIGPVKADILFDHYRTDVITIPICTAALRADRSRKIVKRYEELVSNGASTRKAVNEIVREFRPIIARTVERIVNNPLPVEVTEMQGNLF